jgi:hypothetical protein
MLEALSRRDNPSRRLWRFVKRQIVGDAPEELSICQFDCPKGECRQDEWDTCERRISKGAGELLPPRDKTQ